MIPSYQQVAQEPQNESATAKVDERKGAKISEALDASSLRRREHLEALLQVDLTQHQGNADKLLAISTDLQALGKDQRAEIRILQAKSTIVETRTVSTGYSRHGTDQSKSSSAKSFAGDPEEYVLVFSLLDNGLTVRQLRGMKETDYIKATLPSFQWWSDRLHIYFEKRTSSNLSEDGRPQFIVQSQLEDNATRDATFIQTIRLGQLGFRIKLRRLFGQLQTLYVLYPRPHPVRASERNKYSGYYPAVPSEMVSPLRAESTSPQS